MNRIKLQFKNPFKGILVEGTPGAGMSIDEKSRQKYRNVGILYEYESTSEKTKKRIINESE